MSNFLFNQKVSSPVLLAPLAGITDLPFRNLVNSFGAGLVVSEIIASKELIAGGDNAIKRANIGCQVENTSVQISGSDPVIMADCAKLCEDNGARIIDINMGCPAKNVVNGHAGSALLKDLSAAARIIDHVVSAVKVSVTLKTRLGWDSNELNAPELCKTAEESGVKMITLHGRTRCQFFKGRADWVRIRDTVEKLSIPIITNGDIIDLQTAREALKLSGGAGIMIGRGAAGKPWLLSEISSAIYGTAMPKIPRGLELCELILSHYDSVLSFYGEKLGVKIFRKHFNWYTNSLVRNDFEIRKRILREENPKLVTKMIKLLFNTIDSRGRIF